MTELPLIVFDVNETLLDLQTMEPTFERIFGDRRTMRLWFANFIMYSAALTVAGCYIPFTDIGAAVMKTLADTQGIKIDEADKKDLTERFSTMPPHRKCRQRWPSCEMQVSGFSRSRTICLKFRSVSSDTAALSIISNDASARTA